MPPTYGEPWAWSPHYYGVIEEGMRQDDRLAVCVAHQGRHPFLFDMDACHELPRGLSKGERVRIALRDRPRQYWAEQEAVAVDPRDLAAAIVTAAREMRGERPYRTEPPPARPTLPSVSVGVAEAAPDFLAVEVWPETDGPS